MRKKILSMLLLLAMLLQILPLGAGAAFADVPDAAVSEAASVLSGMGIVDGVGGNKFSPNTVLTRAQFCALVVRMMGMTEQVTGNSYKMLFTDAKPGKWFTGYVNLAYAEGLVNGYGNGKFGPDDPATYGQVATIVLRLLGYTAADVGNVWPTDYVNFADDLGLGEGLGLTSGAITRGQAAVVLYNALQKAAKGQSEAYYKQAVGATSWLRGIVLDASATNAGAKNQLMVCESNSITYYAQKNAVPADFVGKVGDVMLNAQHEVVGFVPTDCRYEDVTVASAKETSVTAADGTVWTVASSAATIVGRDVYPWATSGYLQASCYAGKTLRLIYDEKGAVSHAFLRVNEKADAKVPAVEKMQDVLVLDADASNEIASGLAMVCGVGAADAGKTSVAYYTQTNKLPASCEGKIGSLLLDSEDKVLGFVPATDYSVKEITVASVKQTSVTAADGTQILMPAGTVTISGRDVYTWGTTGYLQASGHVDKTLRIYYNSNGTVSHAVMVSPVTTGTVAKAQRAIVLDVAVHNGNASNMLLAYTIGTSGSMEYYGQRTPLSAEYVGCLGDLLLDEENCVVGFSKASESMKDVVVKEAKTTGIVGTDGVTYRITGSAVTIVGEELHVWKDTGYIMLGSKVGKTAWLYYDDIGLVTHVYLSGGTVSAATEAVVAQTASPATELAGKLGITGSYSITKNGMAATAGDLAQYDVAYFDSASKTLRFSDYQITGIIDAVYPNFGTPETITVSGCQVNVLESAWSSISDYSIGKIVTLLLTDDGKAAYATSDEKIVREMVGVVGTDGKTITLCGSGLVLKTEALVSEEMVFGCIAKATAAADAVHFFDYPGCSPGSLNIMNRTLGPYKLAPYCEIYEHAGNWLEGGYGSYVYSLNGDQGVASFDFEEITWTDTINASSVSIYRLNSAGQVDLVVLSDVTGNCYQYGKITHYPAGTGINLGGNSFGSSKNAAITLTNSDTPNGSTKYLGGIPETYGNYYGIALRNYNSVYKIVTSTKTLTKKTRLSSSSFYLHDGVWYAYIDNYEVPVSDKAQIYIESSGQWLTGETALRAVLSGNYSITAHYDRALSAGAQVRVLVVPK